MRVFLRYLHVFGSFQEECGRLDFRLRLPGPELLSPLGLRLRFRRPEAAPCLWARVPELRRVCIWMGREEQGTVPPCPSPASHPSADSGGGGRKRQREGRKPGGSPPRGGGTCLGPGTLRLQPLPAKAVPLTLCSANVHRVDKPRREWTSLAVSGPSRQRFRTPEGHSVSPPPALSAPGVADAAVRPWSYQLRPRGPGCRRPLGEAPVCPARRPSPRRCPAGRRDPVKCPCSSTTCVEGPDLGSIARALQGGAFAGQTPGWPRKRLSLGALDAWLPSLQPCEPRPGSPREPVRGPGPAGSRPDPGSLAKDFRHTRGSRRDENIYILAGPRFLPVFRWKR